MILAEQGRKRFDDHVVVLALRQAGNRDRTDAAGAFDDDREAAAMRGVISIGKPELCLQIRLCLGELAAGGIAALEQPKDGVAFAAHPVRIVGRRSFERGVEHLHRKQRDIDDDPELALDRHLAQQRAELPGRFEIEALELQFLFLPRDAAQVLVDIHGFSPSRARLRRARPSCRHAGPCEQAFRTCRRRDS
ncbi:hypothetical protein D9M70_450150 [compost metagenome]